MSDEKPPFTDDILSVVEKVEPVLDGEVKEPPAEEVKEKLSPEERVKRAFARKTKEPKEPKKARHDSPPYRPGNLVQPLAAMYEAIGGMILLTGDLACAQAISENAVSCAESLDKLAQRNLAVRRMLQRLVSTSAAGEVLFAHLPIMVAIAQHHVPALRDNPAGKVVLDGMAKNMDAA